MQTTYKPAADDVKRLRDDTGAGMIDCRNSLVKTEGDLARAKALLAELGQTKAEKKAERSANEGLVGSYIHTGGKVGVLVEINCETDFVARNDKFKDLVRDVAMHLAAMPAEYVNREAVPQSKIDELRAEFIKQVPAGKPPAIAEKIVEGKLNKWFEDHVVLEQSFVKDDSVTVGELVNGVSGVLGEKMSVRRFAKFALGE
jgi:elongation factor Ts